MDGLYKMTAVDLSSLTMDLRVDISGSFALSGDVFVDGNCRFSWKADAPVMLGTNKFWAYAGSSSHGEVYKITIEIEGGKAKCTLHGQYRTVTGDYRTNKVYNVKFEGENESRHLRRLELVAVVEQGVQREEYIDALNNLVATYATANMDVSLEVRENALPRPFGGTWSDSKLDAQLDALVAGSSNAWRLYALVCSSFEVNGVLGVMFDSDGVVSRSAGDYERQGFAVFVQPFRRMDDTNPRAPKTRYLNHTFVHEMGHALNLAHSFGTRKLRIDSLSYMNYPHNYGSHNKGHRGGEDFWANFDNRFDAPELMHLRHGFYDEIIPGGFDFEGQGPFTKTAKHRHEYCTDDASASDPIPEKDLLDLKRAKRSKRARNQ